MLNNIFPFVSGFALQSYRTAEVGILEAKENNYQLWYVDCSLESERLPCWNNKRIDSLISMINSYKVKPILHGNFKVPLASDVDELRETAIEYAKKEIKLAARLNAPLILHAGVIVEPRLITNTKKRAINNYLHSLIILKAYADELNVLLYLENLSNYKNYSPFHYIFTNMDEFEYILGSIDLPFFLDIGHANICNGDPLAVFNKYHSYIIGMSFSNNDGKRDKHLEINKGSIKYESIITSILDKHWKGIIAFETRNKTPAENIYELNELYQKVKNEN